MLVIVTVSPGLGTVLNASVTIWCLPFKISGRNLKIYPAWRSQLTLSFPRHRLQIGLPLSPQLWGARQMMKVSEADKRLGERPSSLSHL